jgi:hypothetical protein
MKSDLEVWKDIFNTYKIKYKVESGNGYSIIETDEGVGYGGFTFCLTFNSDDSFRSYGVWE